MERVGRSKGLGDLEGSRGSGVVGGLGFRRFRGLGGLEGLGGLRFRGIGGFREFRA